ncbi:hypothetical protein FRC02_008366 [Tulasnella sp. 418]|nr:hypothetical protein FRC02_008366 [Tulasnella sp. 418]
MPPKATSSSQSSGWVSTRLNNLRYEHIRRMHNASNRDGAPPKIPSFTFNNPSLPETLLSETSTTAAPAFPNLARLVVNSDAPRSAPRPRKHRSVGHSAPASWIEREAKQSHWRYQALLKPWKETPDNELIPQDPSLTSWSESGSGQNVGNISSNSLNVSEGSTNYMDEAVPSLLHLCMAAIFSSPSLLANINTLPPHLLLFVARYAAVYHPDMFNNAILLQPSQGHADPPNDDESYTLLEMVAGANGEFVYVGRHHASDTMLLKSYWIGYQELLEEQSSNVEESWDSLPSSPTFTPFQHITSIQLMSLPFSSIIILTPLIPTPLTHLSLLSFSSPSNFASQQPLCIRRLSERCPRLEVLDLSYNEWLLCRDISKVAWSTSWKHLRMLLLRDCPLLDMKPSDLSMDQIVDFDILVDDPWTRKQSYVLSTADDMID